MQFLGAATLQNCVIFVKSYTKIEISIPTGNYQISLETCIVYIDKYQIITNFHNKSININLEAYHFLRSRSRVTLPFSYFIIYFLNESFFQRLKSNLREVLFNMKNWMRTFIGEPRGINVPEFVETKEPNRLLISTW